MFYLRLFFCGVNDLVLVFWVGVIYQRMGLGLLFSFLFFFLYFSRRSILPQHLLSASSPSGYRYHTSPPYHVIIVDFMRSLELDKGKFDKLSENVLYGRCLNVVHGIHVEGYVLDTVYYCPMVSFSCFHLRTLYSPTSSNKWDSTAFWLKRRATSNSSHLHHSFSI